MYKRQLLDGGTDGIAIPSIERAQNPPVYYGTLEIKKTAQGLLIINELSLEAYLEAVVPVSYTHLDVYKRQADGRLADVQLLSSG